MGKRTNGSRTFKFDSGIEINIVWKSSSLVTLWRVEVVNTSGRHGNDDYSYYSLRQAISTLRALRVEQTTKKLIGNTGFTWDLQEDESI